MPFAAISSATFEPLLRRTHGGFNRAAPSAFAMIGNSSWRPDTVIWGSAAMSSGLCIRRAMSGAQTSIRASGHSGTAPAGTASSRLVDSVTSAISSIARSQTVAWTRTSTSGWRIRNRASARGSQSCARLVGQATTTLCSRADLAMASVALSICVRAWRSVGR